MLTIAVSVVIGLVVGALFRLTGIVHTVGGAITPGVIATIVALIFLFRRIGKRLNPLVEEAQRHLQAGRRELAMKSLKSGLALAPWHPLIASQIRVQVGMLHYVSGNLDEAITELSKGASRPWEGPAFLACAHFKKRNEAEMVKAFERAVKAADKNGLAWTLYAWCMNARGKKAEAIAILERALKKIPGDQRLQNNLELVKEGKKLKVAPYGDQWSVFGVDGSTPNPGGNLPRHARGFNQRPGFRQRKQRR